MASYKKRGNSYYLYWHEDGKLHGKKASEDYQTMLIRKKELEERLNSKKWGVIIPEKIKWQDYCEKFLNWSKDNNALQTYRRNKFTIDKFNSLIQIREITDFTTTIIDDYKSLRVQAGKMPATVNRELNTLQKMGKLAAEQWHYLKWNPAKPIKLLQKKKQSKLRRILTPEEIIKLLNIKTTKTIYLTLMIGLNTGMRPAEICHLTWPDVDFKNDLIYVTGKDGWIPKDFEMRQLPLKAELKKILKLYWQTKKNESKWVVSYDNGKRVDEFTMSALVRRVFKRKGFCGASLYSLRHTFATYCLYNGVNVRVVMEWMGHNSLETTSIYAHSIPSRSRGEIKKLNFSNLVNKV